MMEEQQRLNKLTEQLSSLCNEALHDHVGKAENCAIKSIAPSDDSEEPIKAKIGISIEWEAGSMSPKTKVKVSYSLRHVDEYIRREDLNQEMLKI